MFAKSTDFFVHPLPALAVIVMFVNDRFLKSIFHNDLTGKLSDFAGLFFFPLFALAVIFMVGQWARRDWHLNALNLLGAILLTHFLFALIKLWPPATGIYIHFHQTLGVNSQVVRDPSDLWAVAVAPFTYWHGRRFIVPSDKSNI